MDTTPIVTVGHSPENGLCLADGVHAGFARFFFETRALDADYSSCRDILALVSLTLCHGIYLTLRHGRLSGMPLVLCGSFLGVLAARFFKAFCLCLLFFERQHFAIIIKTRSGRAGLNDTGSMAAQVEDFSMEIVNPHCNLLTDPELSFADLTFAQQII